MPEPMTSAPVEEAVQLVDEALQLAKQGRWEELLSHTKSIESRIEPLERLRSSLAAADPAPELIAESCLRLQSRVTVLCEILRHTAMVHYAMREMGTELNSGYSAGGRLEPSAESHWSTEA